MKRISEMLANSEDASTLPNIKIALITKYDENLFVFLHNRHMM